MVTTEPANAASAQPVKLSVLCDDTGTTDVFLENARRMEVRLDGLAGIVLSHGHDDHTGGLAFYPRLGGAPPVYGHPYAWHKTYQVKSGEPVRVCGMPYLARRNAHPAFQPLRDVTLLDDGLFVFTDVRRAPKSYEPTHGNFFNEDGTGPCPLLDDATIVLRTPRGLVVVFGCGHAGYTNILEAAHDEFPYDDLLAVVGGLHLIAAPSDVLDHAVAVTGHLCAKDFTFHGGHCTGTNAAEWFTAWLGDGAVKPLGSGRTLVF